MFDGLSQVGGSSVLHLSDDESTDLGGGIGLASGLNPSVAVVVLNDSEGDVFDVVLDSGLVKLSTDQPFLVSKARGSCTHRLEAKIVSLALTKACRLAGCPTRRSPSGEISSGHVDGERAHLE